MNRQHRPKRAMAWLAVMLVGVCASERRAAVASERKPIPEQKITLPEYDGFYLIDQHKTAAFPEDATEPTDRARRWYAGRR